MIVRPTKAPSQELVREGIGASEGPAVLGVDPFKPPIRLWMEMTGKAEPFEGNEFTTWGTVREPEIRQFYVEHTGWMVEVPQRSMFHPEMPFIRATPDGIAIIEGVRRHGLECKNQNWRRAHRWGEEGTDEVPPEVFVQCAQGMLVTGLPRWDVAASLGGLPPAIYHLERDAELEAMLVDGLTRFWHEHVMADVPPPVDASSEYRDWLAANYPHVGSDYAAADAEAEHLIANLREVVVEMKRLEERRDQLKNELLARVGSARGFTSSNGKVTFASRRGPIRYKDLAERLARRAGIDPNSSEYHRLVDDHRGDDVRGFSRPKNWTE